MQILVGKSEEFSGVKSHNVKLVKMCDVSPKDVIILTLMFQIYMDTKDEIQWVPILFLHHLPNISFSIQQRKTHTSLERHESEYLLFFLVNFPF